MLKKASRWLGLALTSACALGCVEEAISGPSRPARSPASLQLPPSERSKPPSPAGSGCSAQELSQSAQRVLRGKSTYYANSLTGYRTANGERYDPRRLTAAHRSLPFGTRIRVTRTDRNDSPVVCAVINDRGPYSRKGYILDLSRRAAEQLQMIGKGVVPVRIEVISLGAKKK
jgi:rare lipoprotein A